MAFRQHAAATLRHPHCEALDHLGIASRPPADFIRSSQVDWHARSQSTLDVWERARLRHWLGDEMKRWGY